MEGTGNTRDRKGYDLPVSDSERAEAEDDCQKMIELISELYQDADKGHASNVVISDETMYQMAEKLKSTGCPVGTAALYFNMENYKELENFFNASMAGSIGSEVVYEIYADGGIGRYKFFEDAVFSIWETESWMREFQIYRNIHFRSRFFNIVFKGR